MWELFGEVRVEKTPIAEALQAIETNVLSSLAIVQSDASITRAAVSLYRAVMQLNVPDVPESLSLSDTPLVSQLLARLQQLGLDIGRYGTGTGIGTTSLPPAASARVIYQPAVMSRVEQTLERIRETLPRHMEGTLIIEYSAALGTFRLQQRKHGLSVRNVLNEVAKGTHRIT